MLLFFHRRKFVLCNNFINQASFFDSDWNIYYYFYQVCEQWRVAVNYLVTPCAILVQQWAGIFAANDLFYTKIVVVDADVHYSYQQIRRE